MFKNYNYMIFPLTNKVLRVSDDFGYGHFGASRGARTHKGVDYVGLENTIVRSPVTGTITKYGWAYDLEHNQRYIQITKRGSDEKHRLFYTQMDTKLDVGDEIIEGASVGFLGNISKMHDTQDKKMLNHLHYEIVIDGVHKDPEILYEKKNLDTIKSAPVGIFKIKKIHLILWLIVPSFLLAYYVYTKDSQIK
jgi:murein DD-endopeptidase MepM/ murein hydrolase activator NlpD